MGMDFILWVLAVMIFWDFSTHVVEMFGWENKFLNSQNKLSYYYPHLSFKKTPTGPVRRENRGIIYQRFWVTYWGLAFILTVAAIILNR